MRPVDLLVLIFMDFGMSILRPILVSERLKYSLLIIGNIVCDKDNFRPFDQSASTVPHCASEFALTFSL